VDRLEEQEAANPPSWGSLTSRPPRTGYTAAVPLRRRLVGLKSRIRETLEEAQSQALARVARPGPVTTPGEEPPVVARLMIEIRSDGSQTIARGAMEDAATGERVSVEAHGTTPTQLAASLAKALLATPLMATTAVRAVLEGRRRDRGNGG